MCSPKKDGGMGFRDLHAFNLAMLAKQAGPKNGSSFTWQSIVACLQTFKRGHIWRVGSGSNINIWDDHWMPSSPSRKVISRKGFCLLNTVDEFINPWTGRWDEDLILDNFVSVDVQRILRIPLSTQLTEDFVAWHKTRTYSFSIRSAYYTKWEHQFGMRIRRDDVGPSKSNPVWEILWKLQVPSKIKIFGWKDLHGMIPGMSVLVNHHIPVSGQCPVCKGGAEDLRHLMFTCVRAKEVWKALGLQETIAQALLSDRSGSVVLENILRDQRRNSTTLQHLGF